MTGVSMATKHWRCCARRGVDVKASKSALNWGFRPDSTADSAAGSTAGNSHLAISVNMPRDQDEYQVNFVMAKASVGH